MEGDGSEGGVTPAERANGQSDCDEGNASSSVGDTLCPRVALPPVVELWPGVLSAGE